jgi:hypothetical protein
MALYVMFQNTATIAALLPIFCCKAGGYTALFMVSMMYVPFLQH